MCCCNIITENLRFIFEFLSSKALWCDIKCQKLSLKYGQFLRNIPGFDVLERYGMGGSKIRSTSETLRFSFGLVWSKMCFWTPICALRGLQNATTGPPFPPKRSSKVQSPKWVGPSFSRSGRDQWPKTPKVTFSSIQGSILEWFRARFWSILGSISKQFELPSMKSHWYS